MEEETREEFEGPSRTCDYVFGSAMKYTGLLLLVGTTCRPELFSSGDETIDSLTRGGCYLLGGILYVGGEIGQRNADFRARRDFSRSAGESELETRTTEVSYGSGEGGRE